MNGNLTLRKNAPKRNDGKRKNFTALDNRVMDLLFTRKNKPAFPVFVQLLRRADSDYNFTIENMARDIGCSNNTVIKAVGILKKVRLLEQKCLKDDGTTQIVTQNGELVPNTTSAWDVYEYPRDESVFDQLSEDKKLKNTNAKAFTSAEIEKNIELSEGENRQLDMFTIQGEMNIPDRQVKNIARIVTSELKKTVNTMTPEERPVDKQIRNSNEMTDNLKNQYLYIANKQLLNGRNLKRFLSICNQFHDEKKRWPEDGEAEHMANRLDGDSNYDPSAYIRSR